MPYSSNDEMPSSITDHVPSAGQSIMRNVINQALDDGKSEARAFASAWAALENAGYKKGEGGVWSKISKAKTFNAPEGARNNAKKVLRWKEEHGDEVKGMTDVGWTRANQLANNENLSLETVKRMAAFARHEKNSKVAEEYKNEPWKDAGYVAWLGWGGDTGINWAKRVSEVNKRLVTDDSFTNPQEAAARSVEMGLEGAIHVHQGENGMALYMPGKTHDNYLSRVAELGGTDLEEDEDDDDEEKPEAGVLEALRELKALLGKKQQDPTQSKESPVLQGKILKVDDDSSLIWGWASVISENGTPVVDTQGDIIPAEVLVKAANAFMESERVAKAMHEGEQIGQVVHSFPMVKSLMEKFGLSSENDREGWIVAMKINDPEIKAKALSGELSEFSIGGKAVRNPVDA